MNPTIASPCLGVCRIEESTQICEGCGRTIDEISHWPVMSDEQKIQTLSACILRRSKKSNTEKQTDTPGPEDNPAPED